MVVPSFAPSCSAEGDIRSPSTEAHNMDVPSALETELPDQIPQSPHGGTSGAQNGTVSPEAVVLNINEQQQCSEESEAKTTGVINDVCDNGKLQDSKLSENGTAGINADVGSDLKRRVQWNDCHGKELVHVKEFEASDRSDSEDEDDETESHSCTCTIL